MRRLIATFRLVIKNIGSYRKDTLEKYLSSSPIVFMAACIAIRAHKYTNH